MIMYISAPTSCRPSVERIASRCKLRFRTCNKTLFDENSIEFFICRGMWVALKGFGTRGRLWGAIFHYAWPRLRPFCAHRGVSTYVWQGHRSRGTLSHYLPLGHHCLATCVARADRPCTLPRPPGQEVQQGSNGRSSFFIHGQSTQTGGFNRIFSVYLYKLSLCNGDLLSIYSNNMTSYFWRADFADGVLTYLNIYKSVLRNWGSFWDDNKCITSFCYYLSNVRAFSYFIILIHFTSNNENWIYIKKVNRLTNGI